MQPVTQERIEAALDALELQYFRSSEDGLTRTAFPSIMCFFEVQDIGFKITSQWLGTAKMNADKQNLRLSINELNRSLPLLRAHPIQREDGGLVALFEAPFFSSDGFSDEQLQSMLQFYFSVMHYAVEALDENFAHIKDKHPYKQEKEQ